MYGGFMTFNPELGFFPWLSDVAYILDRPLPEIELESNEWRPLFDRGLKAAAAVAERSPNVASGGQDNG